MGSKRKGSINGNRHEQMDRIKRLVAFSFFVAALSLSYASFLSSECIDIETKCLDSKPGFFKGLYISDSALQHAKLKREVVLESAGFEFMVWDRERRDLSNTLLALQHQRINLQPLNDQLWLELNYFNENAQMDTAERSWGVGRAYQIAGWHHKQRAKLIYYCVTELEVDAAVVSDVCAEVLGRLPSYWSLARTAREANLSLERLKKAHAIALQIKKVRVR